jgi:nitrogenase subunit NifH
MEPISTFLTTALGYILRGALQSKTADNAKEEILGRFWKWIKSYFIKDIPEIEKTPESPEIETKAYKKLLELVKDEEFFNELVKRVEELQKAGIKEKNVVMGDIKRVKIIRIGDREYSPDEVYDRKNIVDGNVEDADQFILGDGH